MTQLLWALFTPILSTFLPCPCAMGGFELGIGVVIPRNEVSSCMEADKGLLGPWGRE